MTLLFPRMAPDRAKLPCSHTMSAFTSGHGVSHSLNSLRVQCLHYARHTHHTHHTHRMNITHITCALHTSHAHCTHPHLTHTLYTHSPAFTSGHGGRSDEARDLLRDLAFLFAFFGERDTRCASYLGDGERWVVVDGGSYVVIAPAS